MVQAAHKPIVGLLGGIGAGKSTVARCFQRLGCAVIDADEIARRALQQPQVKRRLRSWWGPGVLTARGAVNRRAVAQIVFENPVALKRLERLIHPLVRSQSQALLRRFQGSRRLKAVIQDVPLLLETKLAETCDVLVYVHARKGLRWQRLVKNRGWRPQDVQRREKLQMPLDKKRRAADYVIVNNADEAETLSQTRRVLSQILKEMTPAARPR